jgi:hypothetical protein
MWPVGPSCEDTVDTTVTAAAGVAVSCAGASKKSKADVDVGVMGAGEKAETGVEADSVANRSTVGSEAGEASLLSPGIRIMRNIKKPQNKTSPAAIQRVRLLLFMYQ